MTTAIVVAGMGFGDEGKGSLVDYLARENPDVRTVVRYNGGAQAGHNVVLKDGRHHCFSQFGAATFVRGVETHLSRFMLVNPIFLMAEGRHLQELGVSDAFDRMHIDLDALVTTPFHVAANRLRETHRQSTAEGRHGSCGMGIGETTEYWHWYPEDVIRIRDLKDTETLRRKLTRLVERLHATGLKNFPPYDADPINWDLLCSSKHIDSTIESFAAFSKLVHFVLDDFLLKRLATSDAIFEGAQGALLDQDYGFHPHTTWTRCSLSNAEALLWNFWGNKRRIGVLRAHMTRHGAGPLPTEDVALTGALLDPHNPTNPWQQNFRVGHFDCVLARYGKHVLETPSGKVDELALTHLDRWATSKWVKVCTRYSLPTHGISELRLPDEPAKTHLTALLNEVEPFYTQVAGAHDLRDIVRTELDLPISIHSWGPTADDKESL